MPLGEGDSFPDFDLACDDGTRLTLAQLIGKPAAIFFYPEDDTPTCTIEAQGFSAGAGSFSAAGVRLVGVSPDTIQSHCRFKDKYGLRLTLASDPERRLIEALGLWVPKKMFGRSYMGLERTTYVVDAAGRIARVWRKVRTKGHAGAVLEAARLLSISAT